MNAIEPREVIASEWDTEDEARSEQGFRSTILPPAPSFMREQNEEEAPDGVQSFLRIPPACEQWDDDEVTTLRRITPAPSTWRSRVA